MNSYYFAAVQPTSSGHVKLVGLVNAANGQTPSVKPAPLLAQHGFDFNYPMSAPDSAKLMERKYTAMASAATCSAGIDASASPRTKNSISSCVSADPSRFLRMRFLNITARFPGCARLTAGARTVPQSSSSFAR